MRDTSCFPYYMKNPALYNKGGNDLDMNLPVGMSILDYLGAWPF